jgi:type IV pilus assembly protein PilB
MSSVPAAVPARRAEDVVAEVRGLTPPTGRWRSERLIGEVIVDLGFARRETVEAAVAEAREQGISTGQALIQAGALREDQLARVLAERFGVDYVDLGVFEVDMRAAKLVSVEVARRYRAVPVGFMPDGTVILAMTDPTNVLTVDDISMITHMKMRPAAAAADDIAALIARLNRLEEKVGEVEETEPEVDLALPETASNEEPVIKLVHAIIAQAVDQGASDIHCDPEAADMQVFFRVDGTRVPATVVPRSLAASVVSRIKIMASLNIAQRRVPQDGRLTVLIDGRRVDVRVVTLPLVKGEGAVMRILDAGAVVRDLEALGMQEPDKSKFVTAITRPYGAVLVTGPTGSGKSTTLYGALGVINDGKRCIVTIEDPVESPIAGVKQMQVDPKAGVTFANGLRSMLRADPDVMMVGEIRDRETAEIAVQAALTGHLVLSTLHTRDAPSAISRLIDMGIEPFMLSAAIDCVVAQRLARTLCVNCKRPAELSAEVLADHGLDGARVFEPAGCLRCGGSGYHGRIGLYEVMPLSSELRALILERRSVDEIAEMAMAMGMRSMQEDGIEKVRQGLTSLAEVARVTAAL